MERNMAQYLEFRYQGDSASGKTQIYDVISKQHGDLLGTIAWFGRWRQYTFFPQPKTTFNSRCLVDIHLFIDQLMDARKEAT